MELIKKINYKSDFKILFTLCDDCIGVPFKWVFWVGRSKYIAQRTSNGELINCELIDESHVMVYFNAHQFNMGRMEVEYRYNFVDSSFVDGQYNYVSRELLNIELWGGFTDEENITIDSSLMVNAIRGYSAYEIAVKQGYSGTKDEWLQSLRSRYEESDHLQAEQDHSRADVDHNQSVEATNAANQCANTFASNEAARQSTFDGSEANRQTAFNASEASRAATFSASEASRAATFTSKEAERDAAVQAVTEFEKRAVLYTDEEQDIEDLDVQYLDRLTAVESKAGEIDDLALQVIEIDDEIRDTDKNGFYVTDGNGEIGFEVDEFGNSTSKGKVDGIGLGDNLKEEVLEEIESAIEDVRKEIPEELVETEENGFFVVDSNGKIGLKIKDNEFSAIGYNSKGMLELDSFGLQKYVDEDGNIIRLNKSASLVSLIHEWGFIGSSTSSGEAEYTVDGTTKFIELYDYSWGQRLCSLNGVIGYNFSKGGRTAKQWCTGTTERDWSGAQKTENLKFAYVIDLGMNDINEGQSVGTLADDVKTDYNDNSDTIAGWYFGIIQRLKSVVPNCYIFLHTAVNYMYKDSSLYAQNVIPMIRQIPSFAESFGYSRVYLIDSNKYGLKYDNALRSMLMSGGHPSSIGYQLEAFVANTLIDNVIRQNLSDFKETGFVIDGKHRQ